MIAGHSAPSQRPSNILGISAKSIHRPRNQRVTDAERVEAGLLAKSRRYDLSRTAQSLLYDRDKPAAAQKRVCWCCRTITNGHGTVGVYRAEGGESARLSGLSTCGSVWHCPVCAAKITEQRRKELDLAVTAWVKHGGRVELLTLTFPHEADMPLAELLPKFAKALQSFKNSKAYKRIGAAAGRAGNIRSLETTWGENGWHPHVHELVFLSGEIPDDDVEALSGIWARALLKVKLATTADLGNMLARVDTEKTGARGCIALTLQDGKYAAEYIAKFGHDAAWGASAEMTKPHSKLGKAGEFGGTDHYTPFQLLAWAESGDDRAAALFREFAAAFEGKRMLSWSPKLRLLLNGCESELSDEEIAAHDDPAPGESRAGELTQDQFAVLLSRNRLGEFVGYVARCCWQPETSQQDIDEYIATIATLPRARSSAYRQRTRAGFVELYEPEAARV
jgi:hypothetical protein